MVAARLSLFLPRFVIVTLIALLTTATLTFAAENRMLAAPAQAEAPAAPAAPAVLVVPDVRDEVYVFAKGTLEEAGFAWRVTGSVAGYSANRVAGQAPAPGTRVRDTGAPEIALTLRLNPGYPQKGEPEASSPYPGTAIQLADLAVDRVAAPKKAEKRAAVPKRKAPKKKQAPAPTKKARKEPKAKARPKPAGKPKRTPNRPPAFAVPGGRPEPRHELPLTTRAKLLGVWLSSHRTPTDANVRHWLYQHAWVVEGARLGWWHGADALETLIRVDERTQTLWGIGARSEAVARAALVEVRAKSR
jgi:PASTA domain